MDPVHPNLGGRHDVGMAPPDPDSAPPHVTVIVPTYNRARLLGNAVASALAQDYPSLDVVIVDDGSTDDTATVLASYADEPRVTVVRRPVNGGVTAAKNTGFDSLQASCTYFGILDSDDVLEPDAIGTLVSALEATRGTTSQAFGWCADADTGLPTGTAPSRSGIVTYEDALCGRFDGEFWQLVRRDLLGDLRFDERAGGNEAMVWWPLMKRAPALLVDAVVRQYDRSGTDRVNRPSFTRLGAERKMWGYRVLLERTGDDLLRACPDRYEFMNLEVAKWAAFAGLRRAAFAACAAAWRVRRSRRTIKVGLLLVAPARLLRAAYALRYRHAR